MKAAADSKKENKYSILSGALIAFALCFTLFIYAPYELYVTNQLEFWFTAGQMLPYALGLFAAAFLAALLVLYIARRISEKLYNIVSAACLVALICCWVQGSFLVWDLPAMDGKPVDWGSFPVDRICSIALWVIVIAAVLVLVKKLGGSRFVKLGSYAGLAVALILAVTLGTVFLTTELSDKSRTLIATDEDMFTYSEDENFLIVVLDAVDSTAFEQSMARLDEIVHHLESGDMPLNDTLALFEEGTGLIRSCGAMLDAAEQTVVRIKKGPDGAPIEQPFEAEA